MIREVEELRPKLELLALRDAEHLGSRKVHVDNARSYDGIPAGITKTKLGTAGEAVHESSQVEPSIWILFSSGQLRANTGRIGIAAVATVLQVGATARVQRKTVLQCQDGAELPAADNCINRTRGVAEHRLPLAERQFVEQRIGPIPPEIEGGETADGSQVIVIGDPTVPILCAESTAVIN